MIHTGTLGATAGAIRGLTVVDLSRVLAGPLCAQILADHGAEVIKIEPPQGDETRSYGPPFVEGSGAYFYGLNRNKTVIALDLKRAEAREVVLRLLEKADVLIENFLPGTMEKWGLGYESLAERFPALVYCRITGFGADGPLGGMPGYDAVVQAMAGLMSINGEGEATRIGVPLVDMSTGLNAAIGILLALQERARSGRGQRVESCLYDTALSLLMPHASNWLYSGNEPKALGSAHPNIYPYDKFSSSGREIYLGVSNDSQFRRFAALIGRPELADDARFGCNALRSKNRVALRTLIEEALPKFDLAKLAADLMAAGVPAGMVSSVSEALEHPHTAHRAMRVAEGSYRGTGIPLKLSRTPGTVRSVPHAKGTDTRAVLAQLGYEATAIDKLMQEGAAL
ncbi:MAG: CoA transferase [Betaproteobacteria bacterium]|nr:CoA transferase [Betaproteobacteria bacterium]